MEITETIINNIAVYLLNGRIDTEGAVTLEKHLVNASQNGNHRMVLDMSQVEYINSAGLRVLAEVLTLNKEQDGNLHLAGINSKVERVFKIIGFDNFFQMFATANDAAAAYN